MARLRLVLAGVLAVSALAVLAVPASAAVPAANVEKFCAAAENIGDDASNASGLTQDTAEKLQSQFKATAKHAPPKVKKAIANITRYLGLLSGTTDPTELADVYTSSSFRRYPKAILTFFTYQSTNCSGV